MSEPVTNSEIEDVLSSIRRLISESPSTGDKGDGGMGDAAPASTEKLVLTPAFRVLDGDRQTTRQADEHTETDSRPNDDFGESSPELQAESPPDQTSKDASESAPEAECAPETSDAAATVEAPEQDAAQESDGLEQRIAELEAAISETAETWEPDGSEFIEGSEYDEGGEAVVLNFISEGPGQWDMAADQPEYDTQSAADMIVDASEVEEVVDQSTSEQPAAAETNEDNDSGKDSGEDELLIDEEMLREMVSLMVRQQLRGQIGERITRSIRRMVRREIRLALTVRDTE